MVRIEPSQAGATADSANLSKVVAGLGSVLSGRGSILSSLVFILALLFPDRGVRGTARRMGMIGAECPHMIDSLQGFVRDTRSYLVVTAVFGLIVAVLDRVSLAIMGRALGGAGVHHQLHPQRRIRQGSSRRRSWPC